MGKLKSFKKRVFLKWMMTVLSIFLILVCLLVVVILNPGVVYAHKTRIVNHTIYYNRPLETSFPLRLQQAIVLTKGSSVFDSAFKMDICLDGALYPAIISRLFGAGFAWGFYNKVVIKGSINSQANRHQSEWHLSQLLAHEMTHCLQFHKYGLFKSNPLAGYPVWKWEGYAEYVARQETTQKDLASNINRLIESEKRGQDGWIYFADGSRTATIYYKFWLLVQYCLDVKKMSYDQVLNDNTEEAVLTDEMLRWYRKISIRN